eukprot:TRINITY_DN61799_c0_g1_i1.p1 TRINITY_DN61799_c0_g1~~TRINITY_DN61799_c0_g1_i1.p1  ORF type:complete len:421 (+),score=29.59 TRINITY_DN61799_c0_g1_i1:152-1414(+)
MAPAYLVTASDDGTAKVWFVGSYTKLLGTLACHTGGITHVKCSEDDQQAKVLITSADYSASIWSMQLKDNNVAVELHCKLEASAIGSPPEGHTGRVNRGTWIRGPPESVVTCSDDGSCISWDSDTGKQKARMFTGRFHTGPVQMHSASHADSFLIVTASHDGSSSIWTADGHFRQQFRMSAANVSPRGGPGPMWSSYFSFDDAHVLSAWKQNKIALWDSGTGGLVSETANTSEDSSKDPTIVKAVWDQFDNAGIVAWQLDGTVQSYDVRRGITPTETFRHHTLAVWSLKFGLNQYHMLTSSIDGTAMIHDRRRTGEPVQRLMGHGGPLWKASYSRDDRFVYTCSEDGTVKIFNLSDGSANLYGTTLCEDPSIPLTHNMGVTSFSKLESRTAAAMETVATVGRASSEDSRIQRPSIWASSA